MIALYFVVCFLARVVYRSIDRHTFLSHTATYVCCHTIVDHALHARVKLDPIYCSEYNYLSIGLKKYKPSEIFTNLLECVSTGAKYAMTGPQIFLSDCTIFRYRLCYCFTYGKAIVNFI